MKSFALVVILAGCVLVGYFSHHPLQTQKPLTVFVVVTTTPTMTPLPTPTIAIAP